MAQRTQLTMAESAFIHQQRVARLATADENGSPTLVPVCYAFDGTYFFTPLDEKPKSVGVMQLRRVHNIEARHEASLLIDQYSDDWSQLGYVQLYCHADFIQAQHPLHAQALILLRRRYAQYQTMALESLPCIILTPERIRSWGPALDNHPSNKA